MSTAAAKTKIVVCGGNGFLGSRICKAAVARDWDVTSISRSGEPSWPTVSAHTTAPPWSRAVSWRRANVLRPHTYAADLRGADFVVHSMGILLEADYKRVLTGRESPVAGLRRVFGPRKQGADRDPLEPGPGAEGVEAGEPDGDALTYELINRDSALVLARAAAGSGARALVYVSAAGGAPVLPARYISSKREAEAGIAAGFPAMRGVFVRPGFLYDGSRGFTVPVAAATYVGFLANSVTGGRLSGLLGAGGAKPLPADVVANAVVEGLADEQVQGPVEVPEMEVLANRAWRRGML